MKFIFEGVVNYFKQLAKWLIGLFLTVIISVSFMLSLGGSIYVMNGIFEGKITTFPFSDIMTIFALFSISIWAIGITMKLIEEEWI